ncbi:right-handed parallel beta-helix repeat-containing protein [Planctomycetota bacterium]
MKHFKNPPMLAIVIVALLLCSFAKMADADEIALYVSPSGNDSWAGNTIDKPFATIQRARDAIRSMKKRSGLTKPVIVYIRGGLYELSETIVFTLEDSGTRACPITYTAYKDEKPIISGGRSITGPWKNYKGKIKICDIPEVKEGKWNFRQLFLKGTRRLRARIPNEGYYKIATTDEDLGRDSIKYREADIKKWHNINDVQIIFFHSWNESILFISEVNEKDRMVTFSGPIGRRPRSFFLSGEIGVNRYYIVNVLEGLGRPGEWYLDRHAGKLYYWPVDDGRLSELRAPVINQLVRLQGSFKEKKYVQHINIIGMTFSDAAYKLPTEGIPTLPDVGDIYPPSAITFEATRFCTFKDNCLRNVGTYALEVNGDGNKIIGNEIYDTGSGGIITRSFGKERNEICYNHIHDCGKIFHSGVGINIDDGGGLISHNLIHDISHSGIYARHFGTDYMQDVFTQERERRNQQQGLIIEFNEIYDVVKVMNDGAGIFVRDSDIIIRNNLIHDVYSHIYSAALGRYNSGGVPGWGIYLGCETRNTKVENNVVYKVVEGMHIWQGNKNNTIVNNIFVDSKVRQIRYENPSDHKHENIRFLRNIVSFSDIDAELFNINGEAGQSIGANLKRTAPTESNYNVFFHSAGGELFVKGIEGLDSYENWKKKGYEEHSIMSDPLFVDPDNDDYSLKSDSPALKMGFKPIDLSRVGLRGTKYQ